MKEYTFQGHSFKMNLETQRFFEKYIKRINDYASKNRISSDIVEDIEQSVLEKLLEIEGEISQKKIVEIVNAMGEPEDIFGDEIVSENIDKKSESKEVGIDKTGAVFLGVCSRLGRGNRKIIRALRTLFLLVCAFFGTGFRLYIGLFLIKVISNQNSINEVSPRIKRIANRIQSFVVRLCGTCIWSVIKFCFWGCVAGGLLFLIGCCVAGLVCYYGKLFPIIDDPLLNNFFEGFPVRTLWMMLACLLFWGIALIKSFTKDPLKSRVAHYISLGAFIVSSIFAVANGLSLIWMGDYTYVEGVEISEQPEVNEVIDVQLLNENDLYIYYRLHNSEEFRLEWMYDIRAKSHEIADISSEHIQLPTINQKSKSEYEILRTGNESDLRFDKSYLQDIVLNIYLPKGYKINLNRNLHRCQLGSEILASGNGDFLCLGENNFQEDLSELRAPETDAELILRTIKNKDLINFSKFVSDEYGVEFFPYGRKSNFDGFVLQNGEIFNYLASSALRKEYIRGKYENGVGDITMSIEDYFDTFVYDEDFLDADSIVMVDCDDVSKDSEFFRLASKFNNGVFIDYKKENKELLLFLVPENIERKLVAVVHE